MAEWLLALLGLLLAVQGWAGAEDPFPEEAIPTASGYLAVNSSSGARLFYAYYEAISPADELSNTPIILWLQGGPGCSGMIGNFYELGPWRVEADLQLHRNAAPWNRLYGLLFLDNPVGTGFSIGGTPDEIPSDEHHVARDLYRALRVFFKGNTLYELRPLYIAGESYAGKYVPALGFYILKRMEKASHILAKRTPPPFELKGLAIGNGLTHPLVQVQVHAATAYYMGLINSQQKLSFDILAHQVVELVENEEWYAAHLARENLLDSLQNVTGLATLLDIRRSVHYYTTDDGTDFLTLFVNSEVVKKALRADPNIIWESCSNVVEDKMQNDTMKSSKWMLEYVLPQIPVLLYQGQFDLQDGVASNEEWIATLSWEGTPSFCDSGRKVWNEEGVLAGYVRTHKTLSHVVIVGAGHLVPSDQNLRSQRMIEAWISGKLGTL